MFEINPLQKLPALLLALVVLLAAACAGDDGAPGPQGDAGAAGAAGKDGAAGASGANGEDAAAKLGYFQGTISGHRQDGAAFEEPFNFDYAYGNDQAGSYEWILQRFETASAAILNEVTTGGELYPLDLPLDNGYIKMTTDPITDGAINSTNFFLSFSKGLNNSQIFRLKAEAYFEDQNYDMFIGISPEQNAIYKFNTDNTGGLQYMWADLDGDKEDDTNVLIQSNNDLGDYYYYYDFTSGELVRIELNGELVQDAAMIDRYNDIKYVWVADESTPDPKDGDYLFVKTTDNTPLYEDIGIVPGDALTITNYKQESGVLSFDFTLTISKYRGFLGHKDAGPLPPQIDGQNTTAHDIIITGKFSSGGKFYTSEVGRQRG